ncbi:zinc finger protein 678-like [Ptychodera flava]|uniref:zinc finger protein 678-like n=1 Tax=Ptychodera flava TaxID=63121 RepID=UPI003969E582
MLQSNVQLSSYFRCTQDKIKECFAVLSANTMKDVLDFMYTGKVTISMHNIEQLLKVSSELKVEQLATGCAHFQKFYNAFDCPNKAVYTLPTCGKNDLADESIQHYTSEAYQVLADTKRELKCESNIDARKLLKNTHDDDRNITVGSDDADVPVFDSGSDRNDDDDDPYEDDTVNEENAMSNENTETDIREFECKIENEDQNGAGVQELFAVSKHVDVCENKDSSNMADIEKPVKSATVNQPHLFETVSSVADMNVSGSHIKDNSSLSGETHTDIGNNINHADAMANKTTFQTDENEHVDEEKAKVIKVREVPFKCEFCGESFPRNHLLQIHRNREHCDKIQGHSSSNCDEKQKYLCTECNSEFGSKILLRDHLLVNCKGLHQTKDHGTTSSIGSQEISSEQSSNTQSEKILHGGTVYKKDFKPQTRQCPVCKKSFATNWLLAQHRFERHMEGVWCCEECDVTFYHYKSFKEHGQTHDRDSKYHCEKFKKWFGRKDSHESHISRRRALKSFECKMCSKVFRVKCNYVQHMSIHERKTPFKCHVCNVNFTYYDDLLKHEETSHSTEKIYKCQECDESFNGTLSLRQHRSKMHGAVEQCKLCKEVFPTKDELYQHRRKVHKLRNYLCTDCKETFDNNHQLKKHKNEIHLQLPLNCKESGSVFENTELLKQHHKIHDKKALYSCDVCSKTFGRKENFDMHVRSHKYERPYLCEECGKVFNKKDSFAKHISMHSGIKPYRCPVCNKCFVSKTYAKTHQKVQHSDQTTLKPWSCPECKKTFKQKSYLTKHQRNVHAKKRAHLCDICGKCFGYRQKLTEHKRVHTGELPFQCEICEKSYKTKTGLNSHQLYVHSS